MRYISHGRIMHPRSRQTLDTLQHFLATPLANCLNSAHIGEAGRRILALFRDAADTVPAYRAFLHAHGVDAAAVCDVDAYRALPLLPKQNNMRDYPLAARSPSSASRSAPVSAACSPRPAAAISRCRAILSPSSRLATKKKRYSVW